MFSILCDVYILSNRPRRCDTADFHSDEDSSRAFLEDGGTMALWNAGILPYHNMVS